MMELLLGQWNYSMELEQQILKIFTKIRNKVLISIIQVILTYLEEGFILLKDLSILMVIDILK